MDSTELTGSHQRTYNAVFQHPVARNLHWRDVRSMLAALGNVVEEPNGNLKVTRAEQLLVLRPSLDKEVAEIDTLMAIRHFLERSGARAPSPDTPAEGTHLLVVIDHREARIYKAELHGSVPQRITPYRPQAVDRYLHYVQNDSNGQRKPEQNSFYEAIARTLQDAEKILLFGTGTGASSAMEHLREELKRRHPQVAARIVGSIVVNEQHLSEDQLLAKARNVYANVPAAETTRAPETQEGSAAC